MGLEEHYPKHHTNHVRKLCSLLTLAPHLDVRAREDIALAVNEMADKAADLVDVMRRLVEEKHTPEEVGDLLIAFELTTEQIRGQAESVEGKLYEVGDALREAHVATEE